MNTPDIKIPPFVKKYGAILIVAALVWFKDEVVGIFKTGYSETKKQEVKMIVNDPEVIRSIFLNEETQKQIGIIKKQGEDEMIKRDASKVGLRVLLSKAMNVAEDNVAIEIGSDHKWIEWFKVKIDSIIDYKVEKRIRIVREQQNLSRI